MVAQYPIQQRMMGGMPAPQRIGDYPSWSGGGGAGGSVDGGSSPVRGSKLATSQAKTLVITVRNAENATVHDGSVVKLSAGLAGVSDVASFVRATLTDDVGACGVTLRRALPNELVPVAVMGYVARVVVNVAVSAYQYLSAGTVAGVAQGTAVPTKGTFAQALSARDSNGYVSALIGRYPAGIEDAQATYGATGNGTTNDWTALQTALNGQISSPERALFIPAGTYIINAQLQAGYPMKIIGAGMGRTIVKVVNSGTNNGFLVQTANVEFYDLTIDGNGSVGTGITGTSVNDLIFERVEIKNFTKGTAFTTCTGHRYFTCYVHDNLHWGIQGTTDGWVKDATWLGNNGSSADADACNLFLDSAADFTMTECHVWGTTNGKRGIYAQWCFDIHILNNVIEEHQREGIYIYGKGSHWDIKNNYIEDNSRSAANTYDAIYVDLPNGGPYRAYHQFIVGNTFGIQDETQTAGHRYCVYHNIAGNADADYCVIGPNVTRKGYQTGRYRLTGTHNEIVTEALARVTTAVDVTNTIAETNLISQTVEPGDLSMNRRLRITLEGDCLYNNNAADTLTLRVKLGATTLIATAAWALPGGLSANRMAWGMTLDISNLGATNSQYAKALLTMSRPSTAATGTGSNVSDPGVWVGTGAVDTTASQTLVVTAQWSAASVNNSFKIYAAELEFV